MAILYQSFKLSGKNKDDLNLERSWYTKEKKYIPKREMYVNKTSIEIGFYLWPFIFYANRKVLFPIYLHTFVWVFSSTYFFILYLKKLNAKYAVSVLWFLSNKIKPYYFKLYLNCFIHQMNAYNSTYFSDDMITLDTLRIIWSSIINNRAYKSPSIMWTPYNHHLILVFKHNKYPTVFIQPI